MFTCRFDTSVTRLLLDRGADITLRSKVSSVFLLSISTVSPRGGVVVVTYKPFGYRDNDECHQSPPFTLTNVSLASLYLDSKNGDAAFHFACIHENTETMALLMELGTPLGLLEEVGKEECRISQSHLAFLILILMCAEPS